jgi:hypothetical protein
MSPHEITAHRAERAALQMTPQDDAAAIAWRDACDAWNVAAKRAATDADRAAIRARVGYCLGRAHAIEIARHH